MKYILPFFILLFFACKNKESSSAEINAGDTPDLPEGFSTFYQNFHTDSLYQMNHIVFPLQGLPDNADTLINSGTIYYFQKEDWKMMRPVDFQLSEYTRDLVPLTNNMVLERILHKSGEFGMVRRYAIVGNEWHLIYYAGMNRLKRE